MSHEDKSALYQELKAAGVQFDKHYRDYTTEELAAAVDRLHSLQAEEAGETEPAMSWDEFQEATAPDTVTLPDNYPLPEGPPSSGPPMEALLPEKRQPYGSPDTEAGLRLNTAAEGEVIRVDENGFEWYQDEVRKPAMPTPRRRRVLHYTDPGTKVETVLNGQYIETFEVAGDGRRESEVKITLPSFQVGIYKDPRFPFRIHIYNEVRGFDLFEVQNFYGGADMVPTEINRMYVETVLCYDIRTTIRAIEAEARRIDLMRGRS